MITSLYRTGRWYLFGATTECFSSRKCIVCMSVFLLSMYVLVSRRNLFIDWHTKLDSLFPLKKWRRTDGNRLFTQLQQKCSWICVRLTWKLCSFCKIMNETNSKRACKDIARFSFKLKMHVYQYHVKCTMHLYNHCSYKQIEVNTVVLYMLVRNNVSQTAYLKMRLLGQCSGTNSQSVTFTVTDSYSLPSH